MRTVAAWVGAAALLLGGLALADTAWGPSPKKGVGLSYGVSVTRGEEKVEWPQWPPGDFPEAPTLRPNEGAARIEGKTVMPARVEAWRGERLVGEAKSGPDGAFAFEVAVPPGSSELAVRAVGRGDPRHVGAAAGLLAVEREVASPPAPASRRIEIALNDAGQATVSVSVETDRASSAEWIANVERRLDDGESLVAACFPGVKCQGSLLSDQFKRREVSTSVLGAKRTFAAQSRPIDLAWEDLWPEPQDRERGLASSRRRGYRLLLDSPDGARFPLDVVLTGHDLRAVGHEPTPETLGDERATYALDKDHPRLTVVVDRPHRLRARIEWAKRQGQAVLEGGGAVAIGLTVWAALVAAAPLIAIAAFSRPGTPGMRAVRTMLAVALIPLMLGLATEGALGRFRSLFGVLSLRRLAAPEASAANGERAVFACALMLGLWAAALWGVGWRLSRLGSPGPLARAALESLRALALAGGVAVALAAAHFVVLGAAPWLFGAAMAVWLGWATVGASRPERRSRGWALMLVAIVLAAPLATAALSSLPAGAPSLVYLPLVDDLERALDFADALRTSATLLAILPLSRALGWQRKEGAEGTFVALLALGIAAYGACGGRPLAILPLDFALAWGLARTVLLGSAERRRIVAEHSAAIRADWPAHLNRALKAFDAPRVRLALQECEKKLVKGDVDLAAYKKQQDDVEKFEEELAATDLLEPGVRVRDLAMAISWKNGQTDSGLHALGWGAWISLPVAFLYMLGATNGALPASNAQYVQSVAATLAQYWVGSFLFGYGFDLYRGASGLKKGIRMAFVVALATAAFTLLDHPDATGARVALLQATGSILVYPLVGLLAFDLPVLKLSDRRLNNGLVYIKISGLGRLATVGSVILTSIAGSGLAVVTSGSKSLFEELAQAAISRTAPPSVANDVARGATERGKP